MQRNKGARVEREIVKLFNAYGIFSEKVPLSGAVKYRDTKGGDIDVYFRGKDHGAFIGEVKARKNGDGFKTLRRWLGDADFLVLRENNQAPLVAFPFETLMTILNKQLIHCEGQSLVAETPHNGSLKGMSNVKSKFK